MRDTCNESWGECPKRPKQSRGPHVCDSDRNPHAVNHVCAYCRATLNLRDIERPRDLLDVAADVIKRDPDSVGARVLTTVAGNQTMAQKYDGVTQREIEALRTRLAFAHSQHGQIRDELQTIVRRLDVMRHVVSFDATFNGPDLQVLDSVRLHAWDALNYYDRRA